MLQQTGQLKKSSVGYDVLLQLFLLISWDIAESDFVL